MKLSDNEKIILEQIVQVDGDCLKRERCIRCPFKTSCLPEFITSPKVPPTKNQRFEMALDALTRDILMNDEDEQEPLWSQSKK